MRNLVHKISNMMLRNFKIFWAVLATALIIITLLINWSFSIDRNYQILLTKTSKLSNTIDGFIEDLFQDVYTLPVYGTNFSNCKTGLLPDLQHITLNNPNIAGVVISDQNNKIICSTLSNTEKLNFKITRPRVIIGPFSQPDFDQPIYLIQQKMGTYRVGILIVPLVIKNLLKINDKGINALALYNKHDKKNLLFVQKSEKSNWVINNNPDIQAQFNKRLIHAKDQLQSIDGLYLVLYQDQNSVLFNLILNELFVSILMLGSLILIYNLLNNIISKHLSLQGSIKSGIKNKEFYPVYQPVFSTKNQRFTGVEILVRWRDHKNEVLMPDYFISEAEVSGLIVPITLQIAEIAFQESQYLLKKHINFHLAFNLSALHFTDTHFFKKFYDLIEAYAINPKQILFEITERDLFDKNNSQYLNTMLELRESGYSLAIDDYGTGHASISYLHYFPFNYLKIDKLFVQAIGTKAITESLNDTIIQMAKDLQLLIIAEGVETKVQVDYLTQNGVSFLQGWYFSKALPMDELIVLLQGENQ